MVATHDVLSRSPLREALFELRASTERPFSLVPGGLHPKIEADYPLTEELTPVGITALLPNVSGLVSHRFKAADESRLVQLGPHVVAIHSLKYTGFSSFRANIQAVLTGYFDVAKPHTTHRLALRYINIFEPLDAGGGLTLDLKWPDIPRSKYLGLAARQVLQFDEPSGELGVAVQLVPSRTETRLDLEFTTAVESPAELPAIMEWIDAAHEHTYCAFRSMVQPEQFTAWR